MTEPRCVPTASYAQPVCWVVPVVLAAGPGQVKVLAKSDVKAQRAARRLHRAALEIGAPRRGEASR